ncbi:thioredoxin 2 [Salmonella enterica subsp. enterica]|nr:thioredoxin 2 [Salmonella enterica subsp. enterica]
MNTVCTHCQAINRIPDDRLQDAAKCGRCGHELFDGEVINATGETLDKTVEGRSSSGDRLLGPLVRPLP